MSSSFLKSSFIHVSSQIFVAVFALGGSVVIARALGPEARGYLAMAFVLPTLVAMATDFGIAPSVSRLSALSKWPLSEILASQIAVGLVKIVLTSLIGLLVLFLSADQLYPGVPTSYLFLALPYVLPLTVMTLILPVLLGAGQPTTYSMILLFNAVATFFVVLGAWILFDLDVQTVIYLQIGASLLTAIIILKSTIGIAGGIGRVNSSFILELLHFGGGMYITSMATYTATSVGLLLINRGLGAITVGIYTVAQAIAERVYLVSDAVATILLPRVGRDTQLNRTSITPIVFRATLLVTLTIALTLGSIAHIAIPILFSSEFNESVQILRLLLVSMVFSGAWRILSQDLNGRGHSYRVAAMESTTTAIYLILLGAILPKYGIVGAATVSIVTSFFRFTLGILGFLYKGEGRSLKTLFLPTRMEKEFITGIPRLLASKGRLFIEEKRRLHVGTQIDEQIWESRSREDVRKYFYNIDSPHREWLKNNILKASEVKTIVEIGSGWGANLETFARSRGELRLIGVDISPASVQEGTERFRRLGLQQIRLLHGQCDNLSILKDQSADVVFTDALLLYVGPDKIDAVMKEVRRVARLKACFFELHVDGQGDHYSQDGWLRDYGTLLKEAFPHKKINMTVPPVGLRPSGRWPELGRYFEVEL